MSIEKISLVDKKEYCCGCTACMTVCPKNAIVMKPDEKGFLYPEIDDDICIKCGLCVKSCAFQNGYETPVNFNEPLVYAVKHKDTVERMTSQSGGLSAAIVNWILSKGGVVYGAGYGNNLYVMHKRADNKEQTLEFKGSKYVQSDLNTVYKQIIDDLNNDRYVLFTGTPCQTSGLYKCLKNVNQDKLFVSDLVCHGVPSPFIYRDYLKFSKEKYKSSVKKFDFRDKSYGWETHIESLEMENGKKRSNRIYASMFGKGLMFRPSCSNCKYTNFRRPSDITVADFWGIERAAPDFKDEKGVSLALVNTPKGKIIFDEIKDNLDFKPSNTKDCLQNNLQKPSVFSAKADEFWNDYLNYGYKYVFDKYDSTGIKMRIRLWLYKTMGIVIKK